VTRRSSGALARLAVAAGLTAYILWTIDPRAALDAFAAADGRWIAGAVALVLVDRALNAYRWLVLLRPIASARPPLSAVLRVFFVSTFVGTFLPASIGGDVVRSYGLARLNVDAGAAVASVLMDRLLGVASILLMALLGLTLARNLADNAAILAALAVAAAVCLAALLLIFNARLAAFASAAAARLPSGGVRRTAVAVFDSVRRYAAHSPRLAAVLACSVAVQALRVVQAYFLGRALGIDAPASAYFAFVPLILLVMLLPVTFNGIGTAQAAFVWFFAQAGVPSPAAFALSVLFIALGIVGNLPGAVLYALGPGQPTAPRMAS
jgi:hypothetical protein